MVYVLNKYGQPLMPTDRHGKVRHLLKNGEAKVVKRCPFTIQLVYDSTNHTQPITLGVDAGSKFIGLSATTNKKEVYAGEVEIRNDISDLLDAKRKYRRSRRQRKTGYRKPRFHNRKRVQGWLAPSVLNKVESHITVVKNLHEFLPITNIIVEVASFDIQKLKNPEVSGVEYQNGTLKGYENLREYVFFRDNYTCQWCKGKSGSKILHTHHHAYWKGDHTNKPKSLITLCDKCNDSKNHKKGSFLWGWEPTVSKTYQNAAFMGIMRWSFYNRLRELYPNVSLTYGYITKNTRIENQLPKSHHIDALCITKRPNVQRLDYYFYQRKVRCHNRQIHKANILKGGRRKLNQASYIVKGYRLWDKVLYNNRECFISGRRTSGYFKLIKLDGTVIHQSAKAKDLKLLEPKRSFLTERRKSDIVA